MAPTPPHTSIPKQLTPRFPGTPGVAPAPRAQTPPAPTLPVLFANKCPVLFPEAFRKIQPARDPKAPPTLIRTPPYEVAAATDTPPRTVNGPPQPVNGPPRDKIPPLASGQPTMKALPQNVVYFDGVDSVEDVSRGGSEAGDTRDGMFDNCDMVFCACQEARFWFEQRLTCLA